MSLSNQKMEWFHRLKKLDRNQIADIGDSDNPHLYFDIKIFDSSNHFLGFAGVGIDLNAFEKMFREYNKRFGFELFFVDEDDNVTLSSSKIMKTQSHHRNNEIVNVNNLLWYQKYLKEYNKTHKFSDTENIFSTINIDGVIISQIPLKGLNWRMLLIAPPADKQNEYWVLFLGRLIIFILISFILFYIFSFAVNYLKSSLVKDSETDYLTQLPNRSYVHWRYEGLAQKYEHACVVIADIDNFKIINDTYGHLVGDDVLKVIAKSLSENLRQIDLIGRWGGEEFIMILPETSNEQAEEVINRIRMKIAKIPFKCLSAKDKFNITVSFGISSSKLKNISLDNIIKKSDLALYKAKESGRNKVVIHVE
jgi:diguanylate cyclase (GGDEF)-like protein